MTNQIIYLSTIISIALLLTSCSGGNYKGAGTLFKKPGSASPANPTSPDSTSGTQTTPTQTAGVIDPGINPGTGTQAPAPLIEVVGVTSSKTVLAQLANVTGVTEYRTIPAIMTVYDSVTNSLASDGSALAMSYSLESAMGQLGTAFCQAASAKEAVLALNDTNRILYPNIPLTGATSTVTAVRDQGNSLIVRLTQRFWGRPASATEGQMLMTLLNGLTVTASTNPARTAGANLAVAVCSSVAQSVNSMIR